jgi:hypothetical protein
VVNTILATAGSDGASLSVAPCPERGMVKSMHFPLPDGRLARMDVWITTHRRWRRRCDEGVVDPARFWVLDVGPMLVAIRLEW